MPEWFRRCFNFLRSKQVTALICFSRGAIVTLSQGEAMQYAKRNRLQNWEFENQQRLLQSVYLAKDTSKQMFLRAARLTSFLLYIGYGGGKVVILIARSLFVGPKLIRHVSPEKRPLERHEFEQTRSGFYF